MSFYQFTDDDIINTVIVAYPAQTIVQRNNATTGSVYLEKKYLNSSLLNRRFEGFSDKEGGFVTDNGPFTASLDFINATLTGLNKSYYSVVERLCDYYGTFNENYSTTFSGTRATSIRIINIPEVFYDKQITTASLYLEDRDITSGSIRSLRDDGNGNICTVAVPGFATGSAVGRVFYQEGLIFLANTGSLVNFGAPNATASLTVNLQGLHRIPVKIFRCRAPVGHLNASTNPTFYQILTSSNARYKNEKEVVMDEPVTYITTIGLYNEDYKLVGLARVAQPIKKELSQDLMFRIRLDM